MVQQRDKKGRKDQLKAQYHQETGGANYFY